MTAFAIARPRVEFDEKLADTVADITFDYDGFYDMSRAAGLSRGDVRELTIIYSARRPRRILGDYHARKRMTRINIPNHIDDILGDNEESDLPRISLNVSREVSRTTLHEAAHHMDHMIGEDRRRTLLSRGIWVGSGALALAGIHTVGDIRTIPGFAGVALVNAWGYSKLFDRAAEETAEAFEDAYAPLYQLTRISLQDL